MNHNSAAVVEDEARAQVAHLGIGLIQARRAEAPHLHQVGGLVRARGAQQQVSGHAQMHDQRRAVVEANDQVLAAAIDRLHRTAGQARLDRARRLGTRPAFVEDLHALDPSSANLRVELATHGLDLGQLGHRFHHRCYQARMQIVDADRSHLEQIAAIYDAVVVSSAATFDLEPPPIDYWERAVETVDHDRRPSA